MHVVGFKCVMLQLVERDTMGLISTREVVHAKRFFDQAFALQLLVGCYSSLLYVVAMGLAASHESHWHLFYWCGLGILLERLGWWHHGFPAASWVYFPSVLLH